MKYFYSLLISLLILTGCNSQPAVAAGEPSWVYNPNKNGKLGAVGISGRTYDQKPSSQRKLAITRALDELSLQQGVKVSLSMGKSESLANGKSSLSMHEESTYEANSKVTAHIEAIWMNKTTSELNVWMLMD